MADWIGVDMPKGTCSLPECERKAYCRQMCKPHYEAERGYDQARAKRAVCSACGVDYMRSRGAWTDKCPPCAKRDAGPKTGETRRTNYPTCPVHIASCSMCGHLFASRSAAKTMCSDACERERQAERAGRRNRNCRDCAAPLGRMSLVSLCEPCRLTALKEAQRRARRKARANGRRNDQSHRQRARKYGVEYEPISKAAVFERDGWTCGLCGDPVDRNAKYPDEMSASLDHIIPLSLGGPHLQHNVRLTHWLCNVLRGTADLDFHLVGVGQRKS